jgi:hypothetical protein
MSKLELKKELQKFTKEQLIEQITELYATYKPVKEYYQIVLKPDSMLEVFGQYKSVIVNKFDPHKISRNLRTCFPVAKKAIADFSALKPPPPLLADLMMTLTECACQLSESYGDMPEAHYDNTENSFVRVLKYLKKEGLLNEFKARSKKCLKDAKDCGGGFYDSMDAVYGEYY